MFVCVNAESEECNVAENYDGWDADRRIAVSGVF